MNEEMIIKVNVIFFKLDLISFDYFFEHEGFER